MSCGPARWGCRIHWLHLCWGVRHPQCVSCSPVGWGCKIHWLHLYRRIRPPPNEYPRYDTNHSDGEDPVMLEPWGMRHTPSLSSLPAPLVLGVVAPDTVLSIGQIELNCALMINRIAWNRTVYTYENGFGIK